MVIVAKKNSPIWPRGWTYPIFVTNNIRQIIRYQQNCSFWILIGARQGYHLRCQPFQTCSGCQFQSKPRKIVFKSRKKESLDSEEFFVVKQQLSIALNSSTIYKPEQLQPFLL